MEESQLYDSWITAKEEASKAKDQAVSGNNHELFKTAAEKYEIAAKFASKILNNGIDVNEIKLEWEQKLYYVSYESCECYYAYYNSIGEFEKAKDEAIKAKSYIKKGIKSIETHNTPIADSLRERVDLNYKYFKYSEISIESKIIGPDAKKFKINGEFIKALDCYVQLVKIMDESIKYAKENNLMESFQRTALGNFHAMNANVSQVKIEWNKEKLEKEKGYYLNFLIELVNYYNKAIKYASKAYDSNQEQTGYLKEKSELEDNAMKLLSDNKAYWFKLYLEFENDHEITKLMKKTDIEAFKLIEAKRELDKDKTKKLLIHGGFNIALMAIVVGGLYLVFQSNLNVIQSFLVSSLAIPIYSLIAVSTMRSIGDLKEENFVELMKIIIKLKFKPPKVKDLDERNESKSN